MGKLILVTGGARSGKSAFAEETIKKMGENILYIATAIAFDDEMKSRIRKHREQRPQNWETVEAYKDMDIKLQGRLHGKDAALLDCITVMVSNLMLERAMDWENIAAGEIDEVERNVKTELDKLIRIIKASDVPFVVVTNELGMGVVPPSVLGRAIRDIAGRANQMLAAMAEEVYFCVSGIPVRIK